MLVPWRTAETRDLAIRVLRKRQDLAAMVLRTHYGDNDKWAEMMEVRECGDDGFEMEDEGWTVLDDESLFEFGDGEWARVFEVLPELSRKTKWSQEGLRDAVKNFLPLVERGRDDHPEEWAASREDVVAWCADLIHKACMDHYMIVADTETFETGQFLVLFLDAKNDIVKQARIPAEDIGPLRIQVWRAALVDQDCWIRGELGEKYKVNGTIGRELHAISLSLLETAV